MSAPSRQPAQAVRRGAVLDAAGRARGRPSGPRVRPGSGEAACPRLPHCFSGGLLFFGPFRKQRPSRTSDPAAARAPIGGEWRAAVAVTRWGSWLAACLLLLGPEGAGGVAVLLCGRSGRVPRVRAAVREQRWLGLLPERPRVPVCVLFEGRAALLSTSETVGGSKESESACLFPGLEGQFRVPRVGCDVSAQWAFHERALSGRGVPSVPDLMICVFVLQTSWTFCELGFLCLSGYFVGFSHVDSVWDRLIL